MISTRTTGFTLLELLMVIAIVGILSTVGVVNYNRWRATSSVTRGAQEFAQTVLTTRNGAKRANACWQLSLVAFTATNTQYRVKQYGTGVTTCPTGATPAPLQTLTYSVPAGTQIVHVNGSGVVTTSTSTINFTPPYGTSDASPDNYQVQWVGDTSIRRDVRVTGIFGKVIVK